jgi:hypothetical protein
VGNLNDPYFRRFDIAGVILSYSRQGSVNLYGGDLSFTTKINQRVGITADVAIHQTVDNPKLTVTAYRFGPQFYGPHGGRISTFAEFLAGGTRITATSTNFSVFGVSNTTSVSLNGFAAAAGGGIDLRIKPWLGWRLVQADYSFLHAVGANGARLGTGLVFRFGS